MRPPVFGVSRSPLAPLRARDMRVAPLGVEIGSLAPAGTFMCRCNGEWLSRASWASLTRAGDVIEWHEVPFDNSNEAIRGLVQIAVAYATSGASWYWQIAAQLATNYALNELLPPTVPGMSSIPGQRTAGETGDSYSTSLAGNVARLDEPIWKICGRKEITPPFAGQPYYEYRPKVNEDSDSDFDPELDQDQYFNAVYAVGIGPHEVIAKIGNTPITRFADVLSQYLPAGTLPTLALANVSTASEVSGQILETGRYVGGFAACAAKRTANQIGIDVAATRGLGKGAFEKTVEWAVEIRPINDFGQALGNWEELAAESRTAYTSTPQRWTNTYDLADFGFEPGRYEVRVLRVDIKDTAPEALHEIAWVGLRSYLAEPAPLNEHAAHFELVMRASSQLSQAASRDLRLIVEAKCRTLNEDLEWQPEVHTRNPMWWLLDLATSSTWGINKPDSRVDLQSIYDLAQICEARQDRFDYVFDTSMSAWDAMQLIARSCRARVFRRNDVISVARDELAEIPVTAFTPRNCMPGMAITETLRRRKSPDGVIVEYQDYRTNEWTPIECPLPGVSETDMERPIRMRLPGITGPTHAEREGIYEAASMLYRPRIASWSTEMQGLLPAYMSPVDFLPDIQGYGSSGDVAAWDVGTLTMTLTEPPDWSQAPLFLTLLRDDGSCADPMEVEPGDDAYEVVLPEAPDFTIVVDDGTRERPKYLIGRKELVKVSAITDGGKTEDGAQLYALRGIIDDERVHTADAHLLPESGEEQDEPQDPNGGDGGGSDSDATPNLVGTTYQHVGGHDGPDSYANIAIELRFGNDGILQTQKSTDAGADGYVTSPNQWVLGGAIDPSEAANFDVRFDVVSQLNTFGSTVSIDDGPTGAWLNLGTSRSIAWRVADGGPDDPTTDKAVLVLRCRIRDADVVLADQNMTLRLLAAPAPP